jgi:hypothetical protein
VLLAACSISCSLLSPSDKKIVGDAQAARMYHENRYDRACVQEKGPPTCKRMQTILNTLTRHEPRGCTEQLPPCKVVGLIPLANEVQQVGALPKMEKKELEELVRQLEALP